MKHPLLLTVNYALRASLLIGIISFALKGDWVLVAGTTAVLILIFAPWLLKKQGIYVPPILEVGIVTFTFGTIFLGHILNFYERIYLWDKFLHFESGLVVSVAGFWLTHIFIKKRRTELKLSPVFVALFALTLALAVGVAWEILEFIGDGISGADWQSVISSKNFDTMWDLIADGSGGLIVSVAGYVWMRHHHRLPFAPR